MEWGWDWEAYLAAWPAMWRFTLAGKSRLNKIREEKQ